ncbi:MAG: hypothetical protein KGI54_08460 [Pseudomonadota bacterium]|nr:hypothetical protein [Pseudomonadota bacterium]
MIPASYLELMVMVHRYAYYVDIVPLISDDEYNKLEADAVSVLPETSKVHELGSSNPDDYSPLVKRIVELARRDPAIVADPFKKKPVV